MPSRDAALDALNNRLAAARADPGLLLTDDALRDAAELAAATDTTTDLPAAQALGWYHWNRHLTLCDGDGRSDRAAAIRYFIPVYQASAASVPAPIIQAIRDDETGSVRSHADPTVASNRAARIFRVYQSNGELSALIEAIALFREAVAATPYGHPNHASRLSNLGGALDTLFRRTGDMEALSEAVQAGRDAVAATSNGDPHHARYLSNLGIALDALFRRTGDMEALSEAVQAGRDVVAATPHDHPGRASRLNNLGSALDALFKRTGDMEALSEAVQAGRDAVAATPNGDPYRAEYLSNLGITLRALFERTGDMETLGEAVQAGRDAVAAAPDEAVYLSNLGNSLQTLYGRTRDMEVLTQAIQAKREAVTAAPDGHPNRARYLSNLGIALDALFERTGNLETLTEAIQIARDAVAATPDDHPECASRLNVLGTALHALFERTGDIGALTEAIEVGRDAVAATPDDHPECASRLSNLGTALDALFERTGNLESLAEAIQAARDAVAATPDGDRSRAAYLSNLGAAVKALFDRTGDVEALSEAIQAARDAVAATPDGDRYRAAYLSNLGIALDALFERTGNLESLAEAIQAARDAVAATPDGDRYRAAYLNTLGNALEALFKRTGDVGALGEAIQARRDAVAATPDDHPSRAMYLSNLGITLLTLYERTGDLETLGEAIQAGRDAVAATPDDHPSRAKYLNALGIALDALFEQTSDMETLTEAVLCFRAAGDNTTAAATTRITGWRNAAAVLAGGIGESAWDALVAAEAAVELLPQITPQWLARSDREHQLGRVGSLARVAAAAAIAAGRPERAVELLEQTRGVLVADTVDARSSDLTRLRETVPELAEAFEELRTRLDTLDQTAAVSRSVLAKSDISKDLEQAQEARDLANARRSAQTAWDELVTRIRGVDGLEDFLAAPSIRKLAVQAHDGPIVFVYTSPTRCDALILTHDPCTPVQLVPLTALTETAAVKQALRLLDAHQSATDPAREPASRMAVQGQILEVLSWIWDTITEPVLTVLSHITTPDRQESWPRVWWCAVGILAYLPLHAAGHHSDLDATDPALKANPRTALDRVISSYTATVRSLAYARTHHPDTGNGEALIIAVPDAPGTPPLPGVTAEAETLRRFLPDALVLTKPTRDKVLALLPGHQVAHFACHGYVDRNDPANSCLIFPDHHTAPLTVGAISALHLTGGLAYLSACDTTVTSPRLADEAVHITGAFHLAGYQHVIGTLWPISDAAAGDITKDFYDNITEDGKTSPQTSRSAQALHHAIRRLRARYPEEPTLWAAHTHTGT